MEGGGGGVVKHISEIMGSVLANRIPHNKNVMLIIIISH